MTSKKKLTKDKMIQNKHEVYILDIAELDVVVRTKLGSPVKAAQKKSWDDLRGKLEFTANYTATGSDIIKLNKSIHGFGFRWNQSIC